jgi:hypothetical protein
MTIEVKIGGTTNKVLKEKMATIKDTDSFYELCDIYGWDVAISAFVETNHYFYEEGFVEDVVEYAFERIVDYIDEAIKAKNDANAA